VLAAGLLGIAAVPTVSAAFTALTTTSATVTAGQVALSLDDSGTAVFSLPAMKPGDDPVSRCVTVTNTGTVPLNRVGLYLAASSGTGLGTYLDFSVMTGTNPGAASTCWMITSTGVPYTGTLASFPTTSAASLADGAGPLVVGATRAYEFDVSLVDSAAAQGRTASFAVTWVGST
jgi:hypothetical protein